VLALKEKVKEAKEKR